MLRYRLLYANVEMFSEAEALAQQAHIVLDALPLSAIDDLRRRRLGANATSDFFQRQPHTAEASVAAAKIEKTQMQSRRPLNLNPLAQRAGHLVSHL